MTPSVADAPPGLEKDGPHGPDLYTLSYALGSSPLDILALGCGDAKHEVRLVQALLDSPLRRPPSPPAPAPAHLRLFLLDISQPLLSVAYLHAASSLASRPVHFSAVQGNFHHLPRYPQLLSDPHRPATGRRRLVCLFGGTFANLDNELLFVRNSLVGFAPGDLLLLNTSRVCAPADQPDQVRLLDPRLSGRLPTDWQARYDEWLTGPLVRYGADVAKVEFSSCLDTASCPIPGSYAVEIRAHVRSHLGPARDRSFALFRFKRHDPCRLAEHLRALGWEPLDGWRYGDEPAPRLLSLFRCSR